MIQYSSQEGTNPVMEPIIDTRILSENWNSTFGGDNPVVSLTGMWRTLLKISDSFKVLSFTNICFTLQGIMWVSIIRRERQDEYQVSISALQSPPWEHGDLPSSKKVTFPSSPFYHVLKYLLNAREIRSQGARVEFDFWPGDVDKEM